MPAPLKIIFLLVSLASVLSREASGQSAAELQHTVRLSVESENWPAALQTIDRIRQTDPGLFLSGQYDYLTARIAEKSGDIATATASYQSVVRRNAPLAAYAYWHLARFAKISGDLVQEREHLRRVVVLVTDEQLRNVATLRLAKSFFESGDFASAIVSIRPLVSSKTTSLAREATALLADALLKEGKISDARENYTRLLLQMPDASRPDDFALAGVRALDELDRSATTPAALTAADHLTRASVYQFNRDFLGARVHYEAVATQTVPPAVTANALYQIGRGYYQQGQYTDASNYFQKTFDESPETSSARDALLYLASANLRLKRLNEAISRYKQFIERYPDAPNPERPYLNIIDALHEAQRYSEALQWIQQTRAKFKDQIGGALAVFAEMRIHLAQGAWNSAVNDADELRQVKDLGGTRVSGGTTLEEVTFLKAYALEQLGHTDEAISTYFSIPEGRNEYYGERANQRLLQLGSNEKTHPAVEKRLADLEKEGINARVAGQVEEARRIAQMALRLTRDPKERMDLLGFVRTAYANLPSYRIPDFHIVQLTNTPQAELSASLLQLGLYDEAIPLLTSRANQSVGEKSAPQQPGLTNITTDENFTMAFYSLRGGYTNRAVHFGEQVWKNVPKDYLLELAPKSAIELLYPAPYRGSLLKHAPSRNVDPRFVLAIARQESRFQADAKSVAAARGMMQFIASTADQVAADLKLSHFVQDDLYEPDTAILFASQYLASLFQQFPNQPDAVAGAYNGGTDNVMRWIARSRTQAPDRYVAEFGFSQTKDYVFKVLTNYWNYQRLYDSRLQPIG
ncbi:MAG: transglycosylase SLT domain-containing protein [Pyrinomonadaceae bacterium]